MIDFDFPDNSKLIDGVWHPVFFRSNFDTPERLVAGVVSCVDGRWHLQIANALERLKCLYGKEAEVAIEAIEAGLHYLERQIHAENSLPERLSVSGLTIGAPRHAQAKDAPSLSQRWLRAVSALHDEAREFVLDSATPVEMAAAGQSVSKEIERDRLSVLVFEQMVRRVPESREMFNPHVKRLSANEASRLLSHQAYVAYDGRKVAANFSTLKAGRNKVSVDIAKRLMWDLEQHREQAAPLLPAQSHEMFLYHPDKNDPLITERQFGNVMSLVETLTREGELRDIKVRPFDKVEAISDNLIKAEQFRL